MGRFLSASVLSWSATACGLAAILGCAKPQPPAQPAAVPAAASRSTPPAAVDAKPAADVTPAPEPQAAADVAALAKRLADATTPESRVELIDQIAILGQKGREAMPQLLAVLADADPRPRWRAARAIGLIGEDSISAIPALVKLLADADPIVVTQAAAAIGIAIALIGGPGWEAAEDYAALLACGIIVINGSLIAKRSLHDVLDGNVSEHHIADIRTLALEVPGVVDIEKCRLRKSGVGLFVELHVLVRGETTVREGHEIGHAVKDHLLAKNPRILDAVIHLEPADDKSLS